MHRDGGGVQRGAVAPEASLRATAKATVVAIVGGSGSGKSWLASLLAQALGPRATQLNLDSFYRDRSHLSAARRARLNFDSPTAIDWTAFEEALRAIAFGRTARVPCYDFATHSRSGQCELKSAEVVIVDGLWLLRRRSTRALIDLAVFVDCPASMRLKRRLKRDIRDRGRTPASVRQQFRATVEPMHLRYVEPQRRYADMMVRAGHANAAAKRILRMLSGEGWGQ